VGLCGQNTEQGFTILEQHLYIREWINNRNKSKHKEYTKVRTNSIHKEWTQIIKHREVHMKVLDAIKKTIQWFKSNKDNFFPFFLIHLET